MILELFRWVFFLAFSKMKLRWFLLLAVVLLASAVTADVVSLIETRRN